MQENEDPFLSFRHLNSNCFFKYHQINIKKSKPKFLPSECRNLLRMDLTDIMLCFVWISRI